ncbi:hypothetical protein EDD18DRAFT_523945 [Armillaria luteobubalina]|uniref:Uncharacterized protein n=1 Tax=Armillaria luteobubalina TaxID=153913 RepID=A0AA39TJU8_9AGAR|nr:hypothetical protein EDD18DRAFT_523945 [Armillaria luteobubalina]
MASNKLLLNLGPNILPIIDMHKRLLKCCLRVDEELLDCDQPIPGMELKVERLLRLFPYHSRYIVAPDVASLELNAAIQSIEVAGLRAGGRPAGLLDPVTFLRDNIQSNRAFKLLPLCWSQLVRVARDEGAFRPLDPEDDGRSNMFPLHLCSSVLCSYDASQKGLKQDFGCPLILTFSEALPYFPGKVYHLVLEMLSRFVKDPPSDWTSLPTSLRTFVVAVEFLLHRLALDETDSSRGIIHLSLTAAVEWIYDQTFSLQESPAVVKVLEDILTTELILECSEELRQNKLTYGTIRAYRRCMTISPSACSSVRGLQSILDFMTTNWVHPWFSDERQADDTCLMLANLLANHVFAAYAVFLVNRCLEFFGNHLFDVASTPVISQYIAGISAMLHGSEGGIDTATLQQHIDHLHEPHHLFLACTILASRTPGDVPTDRHAIYTDITTLLRFRPQDTAWDQCHTKLRDLVGKDDAGFFAQQCLWQIGVLREMTVQEIQVAQDRIKYVVEVVDGFFDRGVDISVSRQPFPCQRWFFLQLLIQVTYKSIRPLIGRVLGWRFSRKPPGLAR